MNIAMGRGEHVAVLIRSGPLAGKVLVAGGLSYGQCGSIGTNQLTSAEVYDPVTGTWASTGSMQVPRYWGAEHPNVTLADGKILAVGGFVCCPYGEVSKEAETYDPLVGTWTATLPKATNASDPGFTALLSNGEVLAAGGWTGIQPNNKGVASAEVFDPATGIWTQTANMSIDRFSSAGTALLNGQALVAGGCDGGWGVCNLLETAEVYDPVSGQWFATGSMNAARQAHTAILLPDGRVLVAGGADNAGAPLSSAELYTPPPVVTLSNTSLTFGAQLVNTRSAAQSATLTNTGTTTLTISSIAATADFLQKNNCGSSLPAGESCTIKVAFNPSTQGVLTGSVTITDDAANSPQMIALTGIGTVVQVTPPRLDFGDQTVGTTSDPQTVTLTNTGSDSLHISGIAISGGNFADFAETSTCGPELGAGASCTINVTFTPTAKGNRHATLLISDAGGDSPQAVHLRGTGVSN